MPRVLNVRTDDITQAVYIGRPGKWGNPFIVGKHGTREEVIKMFGEWILSQKHLMNSLNELKGKNLACHCVPLNCHGYILIDLANGGD